MTDKTSNGAAAPATSGASIPPPPADTAAAAHVDFQSGGPPDYGVDHKLLVDWINALPEPFRGFVVALETNADPSGNIRDAVCQRENAAALATRLRESESRLAAATALLKEVSDDLAEYHPTLVNRIDAFLAGQPAAPRCSCQFEAGDSECAAHPICPEHEVELVNRAFFKCGCRFIQPAAPTRTDPSECQQCGPTLCDAHRREMYPSAAPPRTEGDTPEERALQAEALHEDALGLLRTARADLDAAWEAADTGARGLTTLADVIRCKLQRTEAEQRVIDVVRVFMTNSPTWVQSNLPTLYAAARRLK